jgi:hypothetical protein
MLKSLDRRKTLILLKPDSLSKSFQKTEPTGNRQELGHSYEPVERKREVVPSWITVVEWVEDRVLGRLSLGVTVIQRAGVSLEFLWPSR